MRNIIESIALENFRSSGFITRPLKERPSRWEYLTPPSSRYASRDTVDTIILRRERALYRSKSKTNLIQNFFNAFFRR